ncbi:MAG: AAA family ATPase [Phycisphaerales bacterium]|nr:AAA family ATPase [Phycisphaerales bacterium]
MPGPAPRPIRLIALMNQKGGVGKTTTTVNLAAAFARSGRRTLIVDLDPQAHASLHVGVDAATVESSVYDVLLDPAFDVTRAIREVSPNLFVLPAQTDMAAAETELATEPDRFHRLSRAMSKLGDAYEFVLMDCPPSLGLLTISGLAAAREVLIPMQSHFLALQGVGKLLETVSIVTQGLNPRLRVSGVILCSHDPATMHAREVVSDLDQFFEQARSGDTPWKFARVYRPAIRRNIKLAECPSFGKTIFEYAPDAPGAADYLALAKVLLTDWDAMLARLNDPPAVVTAAPVKVRA